MPKYNGKTYREIKIADHPLAKKKGTVALHRAVLYAKIGPGTHPCHWCGRAVEWKHKISPNALIVDHLDEDITNNDTGNLVASCHGCNSLRHRGWRIQDGELYVIDHRGDRKRAIKIRCENCGQEFIGRANTGNHKSSRFCSRHCACVWREARYRLANRPILDKK